ncbi:putative vesicle-fusing ATPase [Trypanosoma grayi]|uniref:putative vesicle-fusing ATPase n=1 Tax=Trypanosoma grayi TaxID=71804 RepID=UPI0004F46659|nr:putative vesicle-fusing ATPase [Trypanosoma grayi]KEG14176.1 putative vesicle-fusing ATPase [Trypanosoma grayi]
MTGLDATAESLLRDPQYLLRLHHKVMQCLIKCDPSSSVRSLSPSFMKIDSRYRARDRVQPTDLWALKGLLRQILPASILSDRELLLLLAMLPLEDYAEDRIEGEGSCTGRGGGGGDDDGPCASPVTMLLCLRQMCPLRATLLREILCVMDANSQSPHPSESPSGLALAAHMRNEKEGACVLQVSTLLDCLTQSYGLTLSQALFLIDYCAISTTSTHTAVAVDGSYFYSLLYKRPLPADVHFPLLMSVFAEAISDPNRMGHSGTLALIEELHRLPLEQGSTSGVERKADLCIDVGKELAGSYLKFESFEQLCSNLRVGLATEEVSRLFHFLREGGTREVVSVYTLMREFTRHFTPAGESLFGIVVEAVRRYIVKAGGMLALLRLHLALHEGALPIAHFIGTLREVGVPDIVSDAEVEWLRFRGRDRVRLVRLLCGKFPASREALVRQLYDLLIAHGDASKKRRDGVEAEHVLALFQPEKAQDVLIGSNQEWRHVMSCCFCENACEVLTYDRFSYFWCAVSAACDDDSVFTMILWRCFSMHTNR